MSEPLIVRQGANLPHWTREGATYAVTFRLADSLPAEVLRSWRLEREHIVKRAESMDRPLTEFEILRLDELYCKRVQTWLDAGYGSCALRNDAIAEMVEQALRYYDGQRYDLLAWCVMPNHVHAVLCPAPPHELSAILRSWKGFTGKRANEMLGRGGPFWQAEPYDHLVRDQADLLAQVRYVLDNPRRAGLKGWRWVGCKDGIEGWWSAGRFGRAGLSGSERGRGSSRAR